MVPLARSSGYVRRTHRPTFHCENLLFARSRTSRGRGIERRNDASSPLGKQREAGRGEPAVSANLRASTVASVAPLDTLREQEWDPWTKRRCMPNAAPFHIIQCSPMQTASTLLANVLYGLLCAGQHIVFNSIGDRFRGERLPLIVKTHNTSVDEWTSRFPTKTLLFGCKATCLPDPLRRTESSTT